MYVSFVDAEIKDTYGRTLFRLETKLLSLLKSFFATDASTGKEIFQVKSKFSSEDPSSCPSSSLISSVRSTADLFSSIASSGSC